MSKSPYYKNEFIEEKRKLLYWFTQWKEEDSVFENRSLDIKEMSMLLQVLGFRLEKNFEKVALDHESSSGMIDNNILKIELTCPKSSLHSILIKETTSCKCPSDDALSEGEFWSVSGSGASRRGSINSSNSSLLPSVTSAKTQIIKGLLSKAFAVIMDVESNENQENVESTAPSSSLARHRSLDTLKSNDLNNISSNILVSKGIKRRPSWEVDPKTSPPTQTSSPVPNLCQTLSEISLNSEKSNMVIRNLENIKKLVDETLDIATGNNLTYTKQHVPTKRVSDIKPSPISEGPSTSNNKSMSTPRKMLTPKKKLLSLEKEKVPSRIASLKKAVLTATSISATVKTPNKSPGINIIKRNILKSGESKIAMKSKLAVKSGGSLQNTPSSSGTILKKPQLVKKTVSSTSINSFTKK